MKTHFAFSGKLTIFLLIRFIIFSDKIFFGLDTIDTWFEINLIDISEITVLDTTTGKEIPSKLLLSIYYDHQTAPSEERLTILNTKIEKMPKSLVKMFIFMGPSSIQAQITIENLRKLLSDDNNKKDKKQLFEIFSSEGIVCLFGEWKRYSGEFRIRKDSNTIQNPFDPAVYIYNDKSLTELFKSFTFKEFVGLKKDNFLEAELHFNDIQEKYILKDGITLVGMPHAVLNIISRNDVNDFDKKGFHVEFNGPKRDWKYLNEALRKFLEENSDKIRLRKKGDNSSIIFWLVISVLIFILVALGITLKKFFQSKDKSAYKKNKKIK